MSKILNILVSVFLLCLVSLSACRMTQDQIRSMSSSPEMMNQSSMLKPMDTKSAASGHLPYGLLFVGLALLAGAVIYFKPEHEMKPKSRAKGMRSSSKGRKKRSRA